MNQIVKRSMALFMAIVMCISLLPALHLNADAATINYVKDGNYIYNWGTREETATFLSPNAEAFYADNDVSYAVLSAMGGSADTAAVPSSELFVALYELMAKNHTKKTSYGETRYLFCYTDCENSALTSNKISSFYSGDPIGPSWDDGSTWNREHTWPDVKSNGGSGDGKKNGTVSRETDLMVVRPTASSENGSRGHKAYGESSGFYFPNTESGGTVTTKGDHDVRGDAARIILYVYVRWGGDSQNHDGALNYMWGSSGVIESPEILLKWMEEDPVDTWELGRNDSVESITGTRNVFVDYPELAFLLFGEEVPANYATPSGEGNGDCGHDNFVAGAPVAATCTTIGYTLYTCQTAGCSYSYKVKTDDALNHIDENGDGTCDRTNCGATMPAAPAPTPGGGAADGLVVGQAYKITANNANGPLWFVGTVTDGRFDGSTEEADAVSVYAETVDGGYLLYITDGATKTYINMEDNSSGANFSTSVANATVYEWNATLKTLVVADEENGRAFGCKTTSTYSNFSTYAISNTSGYNWGQFIPASGGSGSTTPDPDPNPDPEPEQPECGVIEAPVVGTAYKFGMVQGNLNKTYYLAGGMDSYYMVTTTDVDAAIDVYLEETTGGYYFYTMNGAAKQYINMVVSGTHVNGAYEDTASTVYTWDATSKTIIAQVNNASYWFGTRNDRNYTTVGPCATSYNGFFCQFYGVAAEPECDHTNVGAWESDGNNHWKTCVCGERVEEGQHDEVLNAGAEATCTVAGWTDGTKCSVCNAVLVAQETVATLSHTEVVDAGVAATCTTTGKTDGKHCSVCNEVLVAQEEIPATGHDFGSWAVTKEATRTEAGEESRVCVCGETETREIPALGGVNPVVIVVIVVAVAGVGAAAIFVFLKKRA